MCDSIKEIIIFHSVNVPTFEVSVLSLIEQIKSSLLLDNLLSLSSRPTGVNHVVKTLPVKLNKDLKSLQNENFRLTLQHSWSRVKNIKIPINYGPIYI